MKKSSAKTILLIANGDLRQSANEATWAFQKAMEKQLTSAVAKLGYKLVRAHPYKAKLKHGFIGSQKEGMEIFAGIDPQTPLIVAEAVWQYSHHILHGLISHQAPILTVANWSGSAPGLVGMLNLNGSLTKAGVNYSTLWSRDFTDDFFLGNLATWLKSGVIKHPVTHVKPLGRCTVPAKAKPSPKKSPPICACANRSWAFLTRVAWACITPSFRTNCSFRAASTRNAFPSPPFTTARPR